MKKVILYLVILVTISACQKEEIRIQEKSEVKINPKSFTSIKKGSNMEDFTPDFNYNIINTGNDYVLKNANSKIRFGIWGPMYGLNGIPPFNDLTSQDIEAHTIDGSIDASLLENYDVIYIGRLGLLYNGIDFDALENWILSGGGIIGESEAFIFDTDTYLNTTWSSQLSEIAGIWSDNPDGNDFGSDENEVTITMPNHPISDGISENFIINQPMATELTAFADITRNQTAEKIAEINSITWGGIQAAIVVSDYGNGRSVYFPSAVNLDWSLCPDYKQLFINAVKWCGTPASSPPIQVEIDIKPEDYPNVINLASKGKLPVAIFGSEEFDCSQIDLATVSLEGMPVSKNEKNGKYQAHLSDINADGMDDLLVQFEISGNELTATSDVATISGTLSDGHFFEGSDDILVINNKKSK